MRRILETVLVVLTLGIGAVTGQTVPPSEVDRQYNSLTPENRQIAETYLRTDCEIEQVGMALRAVRERIGTLRPYLEAVRVEGPPSPVLVELRQGLSEAWLSRQEFLQSPDAFELGQEAYDLMIAISREQYFADQETALQAKYRERAALALQADVPALSRSSQILLVMVFLLSGLGLLKGWFPRLKASRS
jgi:hypothetical protein